MSSKLCPKIILEGTRLTFKTEIAFELRIGLIVKVQGTLQSDGSILAREIKE